MKGHISIQPNINDFKELPYKQATISQLYLDGYLEAGHNNDQICIYNYFEPNPMPSVIDDIKDHFSFLKHVTAAVNLVYPGCYLPLHADLYLRWKEVAGVPSTASIVRYIVVLEDSVPGQLSQIEDTVFTQWKAGDYFGWTGSTMHAMYNFSTENRYAAQITGYAE